MTILEAIRDPNLFGKWLRGESWSTWLVFLTALFALPMTEEQKTVYCKLTGRSAPPQEPAREAWMVAGRRAGKSLVAALTATFLACFKDYSAFLAPGEVATVMVIAADRRQARVVMRYIAGFLDAVPMLASMIIKRTRDAIHLSNRVVIEIHTCNFRAIRGYTIAAVVCDEIAYWRTEDSANPDTEILNAIRPGMATIPGSLLLCISSPYARHGVLWESYRGHYGKDGDPVLVWQADTLSMNPTVDRAVIEKAYADDEAAASAEYGAEFRRDIETFVSREAVETAIVQNRHSLTPVAGVKYLGFVDPSGGASDSMTLAIAHRDRDRVILDLVIERKPPFSPESVVEEFSATLKAYGISRIGGDHYAGEWPRERFAKHGIRYETADSIKSEIYQALLPLLNSHRVELLDDPRLTAQLLRLERRTSRSGRDSIDHPPNSHDDLINAAAGALVVASERKAAFFGIAVNPGTPGIVSSDDIFDVSIGVQRRY